MEEPGAWVLMDVCVLNVLGPPTGNDTGLLVVNVRQTRGHFLERGDAQREPAGAPLEQFAKRLKPVCQHFSISALQLVSFVRPGPRPVAREHIPRSFYRAWDEAYHPAEVLTSAR
jgi:hypothetical protein